MILVLEEVMLRAFEFWEPDITFPTYLARLDPPTAAAFVLLKWAHLFLLDQDPETWVEMVRGSEGLVEKILYDFLFSRYGHPYRFLGPSMESLHWVLQRRPQARYPSKFYTIHYEDFVEAIDSWIADLTAPL